MGMTENHELGGVGPSGCAHVDTAGAPRAGGRWMRLLAGVLAIGFFAFGIVPGLQQLGPIREIRTAIRNRGIDATALFYTESELSSEAEASIRGALRYPIRRAGRRASLPREGTDQRATRR